MATAIIFGGGGQTGHYVAEALRQRGDQVVLTSRNSSSHRVDVADFPAVEKVIREYRPDWIFQLAAQSTTRHEAWPDNHSAIATGTLHVLEAAWRHTPQSRVFVTGSGAQFLNSGEPLDENTPFAAVSPYALARIHAVYAARYYRSLGLHTCVGYLFHHESPFRSERHVSQKVARAARAIAEGRLEFIELGDLTVSKEWTFAGDIAQAIILFMEQDQFSEAVLGSGLDYTIGHWVELCFSALGLKYDKYVRTIPNFQSEYQRLVSNPQRLHSLGWRPSVSIEQLARMFLDCKT